MICESGTGGGRGGESGAGTTAAIGDHPAARNRIRFLSNISVGASSSQMNRPTRFPGSGTLRMSLLAAPVCGVSAQVRAGALTRRSKARSRPVKVHVVVARKRGVQCNPQQPTFARVVHCHIHEHGEARHRFVKLVPEPDGPAPGGHLTAAGSRLKQFLQCASRFFNPSPSTGRAFNPSRDRTASIPSSIRAATSAGVPLPAIRTIRSAPYHCSTIFPTSR